MRAKGKEAALTEHATAHRIDLLELAQTGKQLAGVLDLDACERLADQLAELADELQDALPDSLQEATQRAIVYRIAGGHDALGRPTVTIALEGEVPLVCQRCLQPFAFPLASESTICLAASDRQLAEWDDDEVEAILAESPVACQELLEDELLLCLPYAPRHAVGECPGSAARPELQTNAALEHPFEGLAQLKKRR
jgi:uncharacterized protein